MYIKYKEIRLIFLPYALFRDFEFFEGGGNYIWVSAQIRELRYIFINFIVNITNYIYLFIIYKIQYKKSLIFIVSLLD